ncbi:DMT family transporter [Shewanella baltica]|uniref:DMT family transporter n=1 Tax=Shewanella baltica TaxID=62322 RepID=UPI00217CE711|nr:DMT family transporter [Shewanella baltica]MCS6127329.1 DMT family transporter [Shewanella baltica]MCS6139402.1 DMT family transporter [Shewanella baltica]MCS6145517.1 DMT family transporter [Shewanella baltica]MCS6170072.1 DMT family transporter [Shewanella baltica]MCS6187271.1 DMT family transporter [Shewanella baltica]
MWILLTLLAAFMQAWRNAFQSQLSKEVSVAGVTLARFIWAGPIAAVYLVGLYLWQDVGIPDFSGRFIGFILGASAMQILATGLMVKLFKLQNFAIGAGLAKSEAVVAAILGTVFFGTHLSPLGWSGVLLGGVAIFLMSAKQGLRSLSLNTVLIGLACGTSFALTSLWVREASLCLNIGFPHSAAWVLLFVISLQTLVLVSYLLLKDKSTMAALWRRPKLTLLTSTASCLGSIGWFSAMSLQAVPYVKTLGQVEVFFMILIASFWLKEKVKIKDMLGLVLIAIAAILVMWE